MIRRVLVGVALAALVLAGCGGDDGAGDDGGSGVDRDLVQLLRDESGRSKTIATCIAEEIADDDQVDRDELESIIRGEGTNDSDTANAYGDAALACADEQGGPP